MSRNYNYDGRSAESFKSEHKRQKDFITAYTKRKGNGNRMKIRDFLNLALLYDVTVREAELEDFGFLQVDLTGRAYQHWPDLHKWCQRHFKSNYTWTGAKFWFSEEEDATLFALTWS